MGTRKRYPDGPERGDLRTFTFSYPSARTTDNNGSPVSLATSEPGSDSCAYTIVSGDVPTINGLSATESLKLYKLSAIVYAAGKNNDAASQTVSVRPYRNGTAVTTAQTNAITAANYWTFSVYRFFDVAIGDVISLRVFATATTVDLRYHGICLVPTAFLYNDPLRVVSEIACSVVAVPTLTGGVSASVGATGTLELWHNGAASAHQTLSTALSATCLQNPSGATGFVRQNRGQSNAAEDKQVHATAMPRYMRCTVPNVITVRRNIKL